VILIGNESGFSCGFSVMIRGAINDFFLDRDSRLNHSCDLKLVTSVFEVGSVIVQNVGFGLKAVPHHVRIQHVRRFCSCLSSHS